MRLPLPITASDETLVLRTGAAEAISVVHRGQTHSARCALLERPHQ